MKKPSLKIVGAPASTATPPPRKLGEHGMILWQTIMSEYDISDSGGLEILAQVCAALDRARRDRARRPDDPDQGLASRASLREGRIS